MNLESLIRLVGPNKFYKFWDLVNNEVTKDELLSREYYESFVDVKDIYPDQLCGGNEGEE